MQVDKLDYESFNFFIGELQKGNAINPETQAASLVPQKEYGILKLSNYEQNEDYSDLTFDDSITKANSTNSSTDTNKILNLTNTTTENNQTARTSSTTTSASLNNVSNQISQITAKLNNVTTLIDNYTTSIENLEAKIAQAENGDTTINISTCQKQIHEQNAQIALLTIEQTNLTNQINALQDIQEYKNLGAVSCLDDNSEYKEEMLNILGQQQEIVNKLAEVRAKKLEAMKKGNDSTISSLDSQEKTLIAENRSLELQKLKQLSIINNQLDPENMEIYSDEQLEEIGLTIDVQDKKDELNTNRLYYLSKVYELEAKKETTGDKEELRELDKQIWKNQQVVDAYYNAGKTIDKAYTSYIKNDSKTVLSNALNAQNIDPAEIMKDDGEYKFNEQDFLLKDGKYYSGEYCGKMYMNGKEYSGVIGGEQGSYTLYKDGEKYNGFQGSVLYVKGQLAQGDIDGLTYHDGTTLTGLKTFTPYKSDGKTLDTARTVETYYIRGQLGTGYCKGKLYVNGKLFTGTYQNHTYKQGVLVG